MMSLRRAYDLVRQEVGVERLTIGIADGLFESSQDSPSNAMPQCSTALCRPYGFPRLNQVQRPNDISQSLKDSSDESTSNLPEANEPSTSLIAGETFDVNMGGTPLPPNPFHRPFIAGVALRMAALRLVDL